MAVIDAARIPYHTDGTIVRIESNMPVDEGRERPPGWYELEPTAVEALNSLRGAAVTPTAHFVWDMPTTGTTGGNQLQVIFPVATDVKGVFAAFRSGLIKLTAAPVGDYRQRMYSSQLYYSYDTLAGDDGTWHLWGTLPQSFLPDEVDVLETSVYTLVHPISEYHNLWYPDESLDATPDPSVDTEPDFHVISKHIWESYANGGVSQVNLNKIRGLRFVTVNVTTPSGYVSAGELSQQLNLFLFGGPNDEASDYLQVEDTTISQALRHEADWGTFPYHSSADRRIRVRNKSFSRTARFVTVGIWEGNVISPYRGMFLLSLDGESWFESVTLYSMSPGTVSPTIWVRRVTGEEFPEGFGQVLLSANVGRWVE